MRIGVIGVPGSGKTDLANDLQVLLCREDLGRHGVIDNYVDTVQESTNLALGFWASYLGNLEIALERANLERHAGEDYITCGTLLETAAYQAHYGARAVKTSDAPTAADELRRVEASMKVLACLYVDTFHYDHVFYLPASNSYLISDALSTNFEGGRPAPKEDLMELDKAIQAAFNAFNLVDVTVLDQEPINRSLQAMEKMGLIKSGDAVK